MIFMLFFSIFGFIITLIIVEYLARILCSNVVGAHKLQDGLLDYSLKKQVCFQISLSN